MSGARGSALSLHPAGGGFRGRNRSLGHILSDVLHKRRCISRSAPRLHRPGEPGTVADQRLKNNTEGVTDQDGFQQWLETCQAIAWLPTGIPKSWRQQIWVTLADHYLQSIGIDWEKTKHLFLSELGGLDEDALGIQVEKDLLQSSLKLYGGMDVESFRAALKRLLLAYAHWNKRTGYCQGFIIPAAVILMAMGSDEGDALKVLVYLLDRVLPDNYFANSISALTTDVSVFHELLKIQLPDILQHLEQLCRAAKQTGDGRCVLPFHSVVTMHWFLTLFTSCLPKESVLRIFDAVLLEGSEVLLRVALAIWAQLGEWIKQCQSIDEVSRWLSREMMERKLMNSAQLMQAVYSMAKFPFPKVKELREKYSPRSLQAKLTASSSRLNEPSGRRNTSSETNGHCTFLAAVGYSQAQNPQNHHKTGSTGSRSPGTPLRANKSKGINRFLGVRKLKNSNKSKSNRVHHTPSPRTAQLAQKEQKSKLTVPWCSQKKVPRKGLGRKPKAKSGFSDTVSLLEDQTDNSKAEFPKVDESIHVVMEESRKTAGICWDRSGKYTEQWASSFFEKDVDNLAGVENLFKTLQIVEQDQHFSTTGPTQKLSPLEFSTELKTKAFTASSDLKENLTNTILPGYLSSKSLGTKNSGIRGPCGNVQISQTGQ